MKKSILRKNSLFDSKDPRQFPKTKGKPRERSKNTIPKGKCPLRLTNQMRRTFNRVWKGKFARFMQENRGLRNWQSLSFQANSVHFAKKSHDPVILKKSKFKKNALIAQGSLGFLANQRYVVRSILKRKSSDRHTRNRKAHKSFSKKSVFHPLKSNPTSTFPKIKSSSLIRPTKASDATARSSTLLRKLLLDQSRTSNASAGTPQKPQLSQSCSINHLVNSRGKCGGAASDNKSTVDLSEFIRSKPQSTEKKGREGLARRSVVRVRTKKVELDDPVKLIGINKALVRANFLILETFCEMAAILEAVQNQYQRNQRIKMKTLKLIKEIRKRRNRFALRVGQQVQKSNLQISGLVAKVVSCIKSTFRLLGPSEMVLLASVLEKERRRLNLATRSLLVKSRIPRSLVPYLFVYCNTQLKNAISKGKNISGKVSNEFSDFHSLYYFLNLKK